MALGPKSATYIRHQHAHLIVVDAAQFSVDLPNSVRRLACCIERHMIGNRIVMRHHSPGFQWMSCAPMLKEGIFENMRRICENAFRIPESLRKFRTDIVIDFFMGRRRALFRSVTKICRHRQWIKINKHALERIFSDISIISYD